MSDSRELKIIIKADGSIAIQELDKLRDKVGGLGAGAGKANAGLDKLASSVLGAGKAAAATSKDVQKAKTSWTDFATGVNQAWEVIGKGQRILSTGFEWAKQGAQLQEARASFDDYSRSVGRNSNEILSKLKAASGGTINDMSLIITASKAMSLGVTQDADKMGNLLLVARNKARLFGIDTTQAFNDIVIGIGRQSPLILDNLGIRIPAGFEKMTEKMTETEKTAKLLELTLAEGNKQLSDMGGITDTTADKIREFESAIVNLKAEFGGLASEAFIPFVNELRKNIIPAIQDTVREYMDAIREMGGQSAAAERIFASQGRAGVYGKKRSLLDDAKRREQEYFKALSKTDNGLETFEQMRFGIDFAGNKSATIGEIKAGIGNKIGSVQAEIEVLSKEFDKFEKKFSAENFSASIFKGLEKDIGETNEIIDALDRLGTELDKTGDKKKKTGNAAKELKEEYIGLFDATKAVYDIHRNLPPTLTGAEAGFKKVVTALDDVISYSGASGNELLKIPFLAAAKEAAELANSIELIKSSMSKGLGKDSARFAKDAVSYLQKGVTGYFEFMQAGKERSAWDSYGGNILSAVWDSGSSPDKTKQKEDISKTIAEAVSAGFANADFSNFSLALGGILSEILTKSIAQSNPIMDTAGNISWGNVGTNLAVSFAAKAITGLFTTKEKNKEVIQQASGIEQSISNSYLKTFESELLPYISGSQGGDFFKQQLANARKGVNGLNIGYTYDKNWSWSDMSWAKNYQLNAPGAGDVQGNLDYWNKAAEKFNTEQERNIELMEAGGKTFESLTKKADAYTNAAKAAGYVLDARSLQWTGYGDRAGQNPKYETDLSDEIHDLLVAQMELARQLGQATADRTAFASEGFTKYAPWLDTMQMPGSTRVNTGSGLRVSMRDLGLPYDTRPREYKNFADMDSLSSAQQYDAFSSLQTDFLDRDISTFLLDMVKQAGKSMFDLESLQLTDVEAYKTEYLAYVDKQMGAFEEVMRRQEEIFYDGAKSYEERAGALELYERNMQSYHQAKLDKLRLEKQQEEEEKRMMAEQRQAKMESALSLIGEVSQRGDKVMILQGGDASSAIKELMAEFADNPEVTAVLKSTLAKTDAKARWGN